MVKNIYLCYTVYREKENVEIERGDGGRKVQNNEGADLCGEEN